MVVAHPKRSGPPHYEKSATGRTEPILVITYGGIGDIFLTTPLIRSLRHAYSQAPIDVYVQQGRAEVLEGNPDINRVIETEHRHGSKSYVDFFLRYTGRYALALSIRSSDRQALFARAAGRRALSLVPEKLGHRFWKDLLLTHTVRQDTSRHMVFNALQLVERLGLTKHYACRHPHDATSRTRLDQLIPFDWHSEPYVVLNLIPRNRYKEWTPEGWRSVVRHILQKGYNVLFVGGPAKHEVDFAASFCVNTQGKAISLVGKISIADATELTKSSRLYLGLDTAMTHIAASANVPTIALYGRPLKDYMPYHDTLHENPYVFKESQTMVSGHVHVLLGNCPCTHEEEPCSKRAKEPSRCMQSIAPKMVLDTMDQVLDRARAAHAG